MVTGRHRFTIWVVLVCMLMLSENGVLADAKPHAPEGIAGATSVSAEQVVELILSKPDMIVIDSRKKAEYVKGHIEGALNILNTELTLEALQNAAPDRAQALLFYCNGPRCLRSTDAINKAIQWGYTNLFWFRGGWEEWTEKRLPVISE